MQGAGVQSPVRELDPTCCNEDPVQPDKYVKINALKKNCLSLLTIQQCTGLTISFPPLYVLNLPFNFMNDIRQATSPRKRESVYFTSRCYVSEMTLHNLSQAPRSIFLKLYEVEEIT